MRFTFKLSNKSLYFRGNFSILTLFGRFVESTKEAAWSKASALRCGVKKEEVGSGVKLVSGAKREAALPLCAYRFKISDAALLEEKVRFPLSPTALPTGRHFWYRFGLVKTNLVQDGVMGGPAKVRSHSVTLEGMGPAEIGSTHHR